MSTEPVGLTLEAAAPKDGNHQRLCFLRVETRVRAVAIADLLTPNVDPVYAASVALRNAPKYVPLRPRMERCREELDLPLIDCLFDLAHAVSYTSGGYVVRTPQGESLADLTRDGLELRDILHNVKSICERLALVQGTPVVDNPRLTGSRNISRDLTALKRFFEDNAEALKGQHPITSAQLDRAGYLAAWLLQLDPDADAAVEMSETELLRRQTFTCFMWSYEELRAAVAIIRRKEKDANEIAPSPYPSRVAGKRKEPDDAPDAPVPATPAVSAAPFTNVPEVPVGHMGGSPFTS
jgi:hypothetical protein